MVLLYTHLTNYNHVERRGACDAHCRRSRRFAIKSALRTRAPCVQLCKHWDRISPNLYWFSHAHRFCPSVFLYLSSMVPAIWLLELDKIDRRLRFAEETGNLNLTALGADLKHLDKLLGVQIKLPDIQVDPSTWITLIEQFLMLILIIGRWMLPKGDLTRDQLSQLLLVYIGTAADIIEFFDSYKDNTIASEPLLVFLTLGIWSWSLLQFTIVLSATRSRKPRGGGSSNQEPESNECCGGCCCSIDVWGIALNIVLQDAPFLAFRMLIILHYRIVTYMNVFFTCGFSG